MNQRPNTFELVIAHPNLIAPDVRRVQANCNRLVDRASERFRHAPKGQSNSAQGKPVFRRGPGFKLTKWSCPEGAQYGTFLSTGFFEHFPVSA
jgi:hypothetical protein